MKALTLLKTKGSIKKIEEIDDIYENNEEGAEGVGVKSNSFKKKWGFKGAKTSLGKLSGKSHIIIQN